MSKEKVADKSSADKLSSKRRNASKKTKALSDDESMQIEGCYFPESDQIMRSSGKMSDNEDEDTYRTFLHEMDRKTKNIKTNSHKKDKKEDQGYTGKDL